ncbi:MAG: glycosyltransferase [Candidatus Dormibacteraeota bacterium]|nr:glycosyltransferase [Candidatus Dormibacteraeota bacterium]
MRRCLIPPCRIAVVTLHTSPAAAPGRGASGGLNVYVKEICRCLGELGVETDVFTRVEAGTSCEPEVLAPCSRLIPIPAGEGVLDRHRLRSVVPQFTATVGRFAAERRKPYDLLYSHYWLSGLAARHLQRDLDVAWTHTAHTWAALKNARLAPGAEPEPPWRIELERVVANSADLLVVSTEEEREALRRLYDVPARRTAVVVPGVDLTLFRPRPRAAARAELGRSDQRLFVFAGRLERLKGLDLALRALADVATGGRHPAARLLVIGDDGGQAGERERLQTVAAELGLWGRVEFLGRLPQCELARYYAAADACLLPSYTESFGLAALEAQACGTPVVTSRAAGIASVIDDGRTGFLVEEQDYASAMRRLLEDPALVERMGTEAARLASEFSWEHTTQRLLASLAPLVAVPDASSL